MALRAEATGAEAGLTLAPTRPGHEAHLDMRPRKGPQCHTRGHGLPYVSLRSSSQDPVIRVPRGGS